MFIFLLNPFDIWDFESNFILMLRLKVVLTKKYVILFCSLWFYFCVHPAIYWSDIVNKFRKGEVLKKDKGVGHIGGSVHGRLWNVKPIRNVKVVKLSISMTSQHKTEKYKWACQFFISCFLIHSYFIRTSKIEP